MKNIIVIAIPSALQSGIRSFGFLMMTSLITIGYGTVAVAAYGIAIRLDMLGFIIVMGLCTAIAVMVGQNLGAGKVERAEMAVKYAVILNAIFMACVAVFYYLNAEMLLAFFGAEGETLKDGVIFMHIVPFSYFISAAAMTLGFAMNGAGMTRPGMYSAIAGQICTQVALCDYYFYHKGDWKRKKLNLGGDTAVDG